MKVHQQLKITIFIQLQPTSFLQLSVSFCLYFCLSKLWCSNKAILWPLQQLWRMEFNNWRKN